jgi:hypothetical protein
MLTERTRRSQFFLGGRQARHVAPAILLGLTAGAVCGWNLTFALLVTLALWLNTPLVLLATAAVAGLALSLFSEAVATTIGRALLDKCDLGSALYAFAPGPTAALFGLDDYRLVGNLGLGLLLGVPAAHALSRLMCRTPVGDDEAETVAADPLLRPLGFVVATCTVGLTTALVFTIGPQLIGVAALERLTAAVGAPVSVDRFDYDLWRGELEITNLRITDVRDGRTVFTARRIEGRVEPGLFLRGRLHAEEFAVGGVSFELATAARSEKATALYARRPSILKDDAESPPVPADPAADVEVQTMLRHVSKTNERLAGLAAAIAQVEWVADLEAPHTAGGKRLDMLVRRKAAPRDGASGRATPLVKLKQVRIDGLTEFTELGPNTQITVANLTSRPSTAARHAQLTLADEGTFRLQTTFHLADPERQHAVTFELSDLAAGELVNAAAIPAIDLRDSRVEMIRGNGTATRDRFDIRLLVMARGVKASTSTGKVAGIDADLLSESLARLPAVQLAMKADGRWSQPRLSFSPPAAVRDLKTLLRVNGGGELATAIDTGKRPKTDAKTMPEAPAAGALAAGAAPSAAASTATTSTGTAAATAAGPAVVHPAASKPLAGLVTGVSAPTKAAPLAAASQAPASLAPAALAPGPIASVTPTPAQRSGLPSQTVAGAPATNAANQAATLGGAPLAGTQPGVPTAASVPAQNAALRQLVGGLPPLVHRTAHTVAQRPTGGESATALASDEFTPTGTAAGPRAAIEGPQFTTDGLRQPTSVIAPAGTPGPLAPATGPELTPSQSRTPIYGRSSETLFDRPATERVPTMDHGTSPDRGTVFRPGPATNEFPVDERPRPRNLPTLPRRTLMTRDGTEPVPSGATFDRGVPAFSEDSGAYDVPATSKPAKKSMFSGITKFFGKSDPVVVEDRPQAEPPPNTLGRATGPERRPSTFPADRIASETEGEPEKKGESFPRLRSLFGGKPKAAASTPETPAEELREERGLFGGSKKYDGGKVKNAAPKGRGILGSFGGATPAADLAADERHFATPSGFVSDDEPRGRVPTADYEAPIGFAPSAVPAGGGVPRATDLEPERNPERLSADLPWYKRMVR